MSQAIKSEITQEILDILTVIKIQQCSHDHKVEIMEALDQKTKVRLAIGFIWFNIEDLHKIKNDKEEELLQHLDIAELTNLLKIER